MSVPVAAMLELSRPGQWVKNGIVIAPALLAGEGVGVGAAAAAAFTLASVAVYAVNDVVDADGDRKHPVRSQRPVANGRVSVRHAAMLAAVSAVLAIAIAFGVGAGLVILAYLLINTAYTARLKRVPFVELGCVIAGFVLRVTAGVAAAAWPVGSYWLIAAVAAAALTLISSKRLGELLGSRTTRAVLGSYSPELLRTLIVTGSFGAFVAAATWSVGISGHGWFALPGGAVLAGRVALLGWRGLLERPERVITDRWSVTFTVLAALALVL